MNYYLLPSAPGSLSVVKGGMLSIPLVIVELIQSTTYDPSLKNGCENFTTREKG